MPKLHSIQKHGMKYLLLVFFFGGSFSYGQNIFTSHDTVEVYQPVETILGESFFQIPVNFSQDDLLKSIPADLNDVSIQRIDLVYTVYKTSPDFDQEKLNENRVSQLKKAWPAVANNLISWNSYGQNKATNSEDAKAMFHGFYVYYRPIPTKESMEAEIAFLDDLFFGDAATSTETAIREDSESARTNVAIVSTEAHAVEPEKTSEIITSVDFITGITTCFEPVKQRMFSEGEFKVSMDSVMTLPGFYGYSESAVMDRRLNTYPKDVIWYFALDSCDTGASRSTSAIAYTPAKDYEVVETVFNRNPTWTNSLVVMDVTGSMSSYIAKTMAWVKATQNDPKVSAFVFFNDGDQKLNYQKITGKVGGIYSVPNGEFNSVYQVMKQTMQNGGGGDCPENNLEATLYGIEKYGDCDEVIMVADNWATPRDLELVAQLNVPIHIILCGTGYGINIEYIQLAIDSGGSIHTIEEDLDTRDIKPGVAFELGNAFYTIVNGKVVKAENK